MRLKMMMVGLLGLGLTGAPVFAADVPSQTPAQPARPGTVNYVEGTAYLDGQQIGTKDAGNAALDAGQELTTDNGKVEILLTPGVFLRLDSSSSLKMVSPDITLTQVQLDKGRAGIEVDEIHNENNLQVIDAGVATRLDKKGYYEFDANQPTAMVYTGEAKAEVADGDWRKIKGGHELMLTGGPKGQSLAKEKPAGFDKNAGDDLYNWSKLRSQYLAEANNQIADEYADAGYGPGWYWNPYGWGYTFIGADPFYSPFGWGFYPLGWGWGGPWYGGYGGYGWYGRGRYWGHEPHPRYGAFHGGTHVYRGGRMQTYGGGGFHGGGMGGFHGGSMGGFHGGGGGFHGGMGGGHR